MTCPENVQIMADQSEISSFIERYIRRPIYLDRVNAALRVVFPASQNVTLSGTNTVATVTSMTQKAGVDLGVTELRWAMQNKWKNGVRPYML